MKKLIFLFTMVLAGSLAMAQNNTSKVSQSGKKHEATVDQQGVGNNTSYVIQESAKNFATVSQINPVFDGSFADDNNLSTVVQTGARNYATVSQEHDHGHATWGSGGGVLEAKIYQSGDKNRAEQIQGPNNQMGRSLASIDQSGNNNDAYQNQLKYDNDAYITQSGNGNTARQAQDNELPLIGSHNRASINQSGNNNFSEQEQDGWNNRAEAIQSGNGNHASQIQKDYSYESNAFVKQTGNNNEAIQNAVGFLNHASIEQHSDGNYAFQKQESKNGAPDGYTHNYPAFNKAEIFQWGGNGNTALQRQFNEEGNVSNYAGIGQNGSNNHADQTQWGGFNSSTIMQVGNGNGAFVTQNQLIGQ